MKIVIPLVLFILTFNYVNSQGFCRHKTRPISKQEMDIIIQSSQLDQIKAIGCRENNVYTIPVVIHIMHSGQPTGTGINISDQQAGSLIDAMNRDFRASNTISQRGSYVDTGIEFCLAQEDPTGNPSTGITRHDCSSVGDYSSKGVRAFTADGVRPSDIISLPNATWDVDRFLNIWVVGEIDNQGQDNPNTFAGGTLGFATLSPNITTTPSQIASSPMGDPAGGTMPGYTGCFLTATSCLGVETAAEATAAGYFFLNSASAYQGRVGTHEIGHYFGLPHPFDDSNPSTCANGDGIADTGDAKQEPNVCSGSGCPSQNAENYMDYYNASCVGEFTAGQKAVMRSRLNATNGGYRTLTQCGLCEAEYELSLDSIVINENNCDLTFDANLNIKNNGTQDITSFDIRYRNNAGTWTTYNWTGSITTGNTTTVNIPSIQGVNGNNNFEAEIIINSLNTNRTDQKTYNNQKSIEFTITQTSNVSISATDTEICLGDTITLTASGSDSYSWNNGLGSGDNKNVTPSSTQTYIVTGTQAGCNSMDSIQISVKPSPTITSSNIENETCLSANGSFIVSSNGGQTPYQYSINNGAFSNTVTFSNLSNGSYIVKTKDADNCESLPITVSIINEGGFESSISNSQRICEGESTNIIVTSNGSGITHNWNNGLSNSSLHSVSPNQTTEYIVELVDNIGCKDTLSTTVFVDEMPNLSVTPSNVEICQGDSITFTSSGANKYVWSNGDSISQVTITFQHSSSVNVVGINGVCSQQTSVPVSVSPNATVVASANTYTINTGDGIQFFNTGSTASSYSWNFGDGNNSIFGNPYHVFNFPGAYNVVLTGTAGICQNTDTLLIYVGSVDITENNKISTSIYPNPTKNYINILSEEDIKEISIYNKLGQKVFKTNEKNIKKIDVSKLSNGVYSLIIKLNEKTDLHRIKIIK